MTEQQRPRGLLFDIGGVCVISPFQAILDYERANSIPPGWVNFSISRTSPNGSWHKLERGEILLDAKFFEEFNHDLRKPELWTVFHERLLQTKHSSPPVTPQSILPPLPDIDGEWLFYEMMRIAQTPDPYMFPALKKIKASNQFLIGALSNTIIFPDGHPYNNTSEVKNQFDFFISSAHTGVRKPTPEAYQLAVEKMRELATSRGIHDLQPSDILFLDDIGENLKAAKQAGLRTLRVVLGRTEAAVRELEQATGLSLLDDERSRL